MKKTWIYILIGLTAFCVSCDELNELTGLSESEIVQGLKEALNIGTDTSVSTASAVDGYLRNEVIKILLPAEVQALQTQIETGSINLGITTIPYTTLLDAYVAVNPNLDTDPFEQLVVAMNRGAEQAATKAKPIFVNAITDMSIADGLEILQGGETAATAYFEEVTGDQLVASFQPDVRAALDQTQANQIYLDIAGFLSYSYDPGIIGVPNIVVSDFIDIGIELPENIDGYATEKAVDGLFYLVGEEEKKIRADPFAWANDIIARVFGSPQAQGGN